MVLELKPVDHLQEGALEGLIEELQDSAAADADQMLMVAPAEDVLIVEVRIAEVYLAHQAGVDEQFQCPIDRGDRDLLTAESGPKV